MAASFEFGLQLAVVVNLAVEDDCDLPVFARHRLVSAREVNYREASHSERDAFREERALIVRPPMTNHAQHPFERVSALLGRELRVVTGETGDAAHRSKVLLKSKAVRPSVLKAKAVRVNFKTATEAQRHREEEMDCHYVQSFLISVSPCLRWLILQL